MAFGDIIRSFSFLACAGLTFDGKYLWAGRYSDNTLYQIDPNTFSIIRGLVLALQAPNNGLRGVTFDGKNLWVTERGGTLVAGNIYEIDMQGNIIRGFVASLNPSEIGFDGKSLWWSDETLGAAFINQIDFSGNITQRFVGNTNPAGIDFLDGKMIHADWGANRVYLYTKDFVQLTSVVGPGSRAHALCFDGKYMWLGDWGSNLIYQLSVD